MMEIGLIIEEVFVAVCAVFAVYAVLFVLKDYFWYDD